MNFFLILLCIVLFVGMLIYARKLSITNKSYLAIQKSINASNVSFSSITPYQFEEYVAEYLSTIGYTHVDVTPKSGDYGADVVAVSPDGIKTAIQCKLYFSNSVGVKAVQEVYSAMGYYHCAHGSVYCNSGYTKAARNMADELGVELYTIKENAINVVNLFEENAIITKRKRKESLILSFLIIALIVTNAVACINGSRKSKDAEICNTSQEEIVKQSQYLSGTLFVDRYQDKPSTGIFTNKLKDDVIVECYYQNVQDVVLSFALNSNETVSIEMPYATLNIYIINNNQLYNVKNKVPFKTNETQQITISESSIHPVDKMT